MGLTSSLITFKTELHDEFISSGGGACASVEFHFRYHETNFVLGTTFTAWEIPVAIGKHSLYYGVKLIAKLLQPSYGVHHLLKTTLCSQLLKEFHLRLNTYQRIRCNRTRRRHTWKADTRKRGIAACQQIGNRSHRTSQFP